MMLGNISDLAIQEVRSQKTGQLYTLSKTLTEGLKAGEFTLRHETIPPGHQSSAPHAHSQVSELFYVLSGKVLAWVGGQSHPLETGGYVHFQGGDNEMHYLENASEIDAVVLQISSQVEEDRVEY